MREITELGRTRPDEARRSLAAEYALNWLLDCFTKPTVSLIDGLAMGSGVGISLYGTHRVAGERYRFAMPETGIGLFPDDGVRWAFARMPDEIGMYLALTGRAIGRADAYRLGLVTHCIPAARFGEIAGRDRRRRSRRPGARRPPRGPRPRRARAAAAVIARCFRRRHGRGHHRAAAGRARRRRGLGARRCSPTCATLADLAQDHPPARAAGARRSTCAATLIQDYRLACRCLEAHDFHEGVRAALIDKDRAPKWQPARLEDVTEAMVDAYFAPLGPGELELAPRRDAGCGPASACSLGKARRR